MGDDLFYEKYSANDKWYPKYNKGTLKHDAGIVNVETSGVKTIISFDDGFKFTGFDCMISDQNRGAYIHKIDVSVSPNNVMDIQLRAIEKHMEIVGQFYDNQGLDAGMVSSGVMPAPEMLLLRSKFEQTVLPDRIHQNRATFIRDVHQRGYLFHSISRVFGEEGFSNPYSLSQFRVISGVSSNGFCVIKLIFPRPEVDWLCYVAYLIYKPNSRVMGYYTIERNDAAGVPMICSVSMYGSERKRTALGNYLYSTDRLLIDVLASMMENPDYMSRMEMLAQEAERMKEQEEKMKSMWTCSRCGKANGEHMFICKCGMKKSENGLVE